MTWRLVSFDNAPTQGTNGTKKGESGDDRPHSNLKWCAKFPIKPFWPHFWLRMYPVPRQRSPRHPLLPGLFWGVRERGCPAPVPPEPPTNRAQCRQWERGLSGAGGDYELWMTDMWPPCLLKSGCKCSVLKRFWKLFGDVLSQPVRTCVRVGGEEEPHSDNPRLLNIGGTEVDMNATWAHVSHCTTHARAHMHLLKARAWTCRQPKVCTLAFGHISHTHFTFI